MLGKRLGHYLNIQTTLSDYVIDRVKWDIVENIPE